MKLICKVLLDRIPVLALVHDCYLLPQENMYSFFLKKKITLKTNISLLRISLFLCIFGVIAELTIKFHQVVLGKVWVGQGES
jgi:hypothetical protein